MNAPAIKSWRPTRAQLAFLRCPAFDVMYGGAAGGGKSESALYGLTRWIHHPSYRGLILRRTSPELIMSVWERSFHIYPFLGGRPNVQHKIWRFPSGATITFGHLERDSSVHRYQSAEFQWVFFDELTSFTEYQYTYLISRMRSTAGIPLRLRSGTNPGGSGHPWVLKRWAPWLYPPGVRVDEYAGPYARPGEIVWFLRDPIADTETIVHPNDWIDCPHCGQEWRARGPAAPVKIKGKCRHLAAISRTFFPARVEDNPHLDAAYAAGLTQLDPLSYLQLREGDWMARPTAGMFFKRPWLRIEEEAPTFPEVEAVIRYWDRAATEPSDENNDPDWTAGVLMARTRSGHYWILDVERFRCEPHEIEDRIEAVTERDLRNEDKDGRTLLVGSPTLAPIYVVGLEQDPGQAGKVDIYHLVKRLSKVAIEVVRPTGDKVTRAKPWSARCKLGFARLRRARWNEAYVREHTDFPEGKKDQVDASSGGYSVIADQSALPAHLPRGAIRETARGAGGF